MTRRRRSTLRRWWDRFAKGLRYLTDVHYARRSDGAKKAARTRRAKRAAEPIEFNELTDRDLYHGTYINKVRT